MGRRVKCYPGHPEKARKLQRALYANVPEGRQTMSKKSRLKEQDRRSRRILKDQEEKEILAEREELDDEEEALIERAIAAAEAGDEPEIKEKDYYGESASAPVYSVTGARTWEELDAAKEAIHKNDMIRDATYSVQDLVRNILWDYTMSPEQKANAIKAVGDGFGMRVQEIVDKPLMDKALDDDLDLLEAEAMLARDSRNVSGVARIADKIIRRERATARESLAEAVTKIRAGDAETRKALPELRANALKHDIGKQKSNSIIIEKDASGQWRAVLWPTNRWMDYDGEILSDAAHKEYVEWVNANMDLAPAFITKHIPQTRREHQTDFVAYEEGFVIMSAPLTDQEAGRLLKAQTLTDIGLSHGSFVVERDPQNPKVITKYRMFEVSDLPLEKAANPFTSMELISKEVGMDTKAYLAVILGSSEKAEEYLKKSGVLKEQLDEAGVKSAEKQNDLTPPTVPPTLPAAPAPIDIQALIKAVGQEFDIQGLSETIAKLQAEAEKVPVLEALVKDMSQDIDEKLAEKIAPPIAKSFSWSSKRASQRDDTVLDPEKDQKDKKLAEATPEAGWLSQYTGTEPLPVHN